MSKTSSIDADNPLAALVAELDEFPDAKATLPSKSKGTTRPEGHEEVSESEADVVPRSEPQAETRLRTEREEPDTKTASPQKSIDLQVRAVAAVESEAKTQQVRSDSPIVAKRPVNRSSTQNLEDQVKIPARAGTKSAAAATFVVNSKAAAKPSRKRHNMRGLMAGAAALLAIVGTGYLFMQGSKPASSEIVVYAAPVFDDEVETPALAATKDEPDSKVLPTTVTDVFIPKKTQEQVIDEPVSPDQGLDGSETIVAAVTPPLVTLQKDTVKKSKPFGFDEKFSAEFPELEGQSLLDLATGVPIFSPSSIVPDSQWEDVSCGGCHAFDQANLCEQGAYYFNHDEARIARIQHPYGGGFKTKLMEWAEGGCQ